MKQQTAVEWLADEIIMLEERLRQGKVKFIDFFDFKDILVEQAKEMESQHMNNIHNNARDNIFDWLKKMDYDFLVEEILKSE
jgi:uncharacterized protein YfeS